MFKRDYFSLDKKVAIITGGNTGIGLAICEALAESGADLFVTHYDDNLSDIKKIAKDKGVKLELWQGDLTKEGAAESVVASAVKSYGRIDILINNAGNIKRNPILEFTKSDWDVVMNINLNTVWHMSQEVAKVMKKQKQGKIINIASMLSFQGGKFVPSYTASKHGVAGLTKAFANEMAEHGVQSNAIAPGYINTANTAPLMADKKRNAEILGRIPAGRWGETTDLMGTVVFLASKASDYVNGHILCVDGGWLVR